MTIAEAKARCKSALKSLPQDVLTVALVLLATLAGFLLGYLSGRAERPAFSISAAELTSSEQDPEAESQSSDDRLSAEEGEVVASRHGSKYYLPWCAAAAHISDANKITFANKTEAEAAGYKLATSCN